MKLNRQQIEEQGLTVWQQSILFIKGVRRFALVEEVDTDTGTCVYWTVPSTDPELQKADKAFTEEFLKDEQRKERAALDLDDLMVLKKVTGAHLIVLDPLEKIVAETPESVGHP
jgi:hypothetical protein